jgi:hypothetical protein
MPEGGSIVNLGDLTKPATTLIEKISDAIGGIFRPYQIRRLAQAEAEAEKIKAVSQIEITDLQRRAVRRFFAEEAIKQANIEAIAQKALPELRDDAHPEQMENDWIANFFDKCRLISDEEMQSLWSRLLAGQANSPGRYSKRTVNLLAEMDKADAEMFRILCSFRWTIDEHCFPLIYGYRDSIYAERGISFAGLKHLESTGLISFDPRTAFGETFNSNVISVSYYSDRYTVESSAADGAWELNLGSAFFSQSGEQLSAICGARSVPGFRDHVIDKWRSWGRIVTAVEVGQKENSD